MGTAVRSISHASLGAFAVTFDFISSGAAGLVGDRGGGLAEGGSIPAGVPVPAAGGHPGGDAQIRAELPLRGGGQSPAGEQAAVYEPVGLFRTAKTPTYEYNNS